MVLECLVFYGSFGLGWLAGSLCWVLWDCLKMLILAVFGLVVCKFADFG